MEVCVCPCVMLLHGYHLKFDLSSSLCAHLTVKAWTFRATAGVDLESIADRTAIRKAVQSGNVEDAIERVNDLNPEVRYLVFPT